MKSANMHYFRRVFKKFKDTALQFRAVWRRTQLIDEFLRKF